MRKLLCILAIVASLLPPTAHAASDKDRQAYNAMTACFAEKAKLSGDLATPLEDMADVIIGMCLNEVDQYRSRETGDWGVNWAAFVGPYFTMQVTAKAKEAVYVYRVTKRP